MGGTNPKPKLGKSKKVKPYDNLSSAAMMFASNRGVPNHTLQTSGMTT